VVPTRPGLSSLYIEHRCTDRHNGPLLTGCAQCRTAHDQRHSLRRTKARNTNHFEVTFNMPYQFPMAYANTSSVHARREDLNKKILQKDFE